jgi:hypothetical protein
MECQPSSEDVDAWPQCPFFNRDQYDGKTKRLFDVGDWKSPFHTSIVSKSFGSCGRIQNKMNDVTKISPKRKKWVIEVDRQREL